MGAVLQARGRGGMAQRHTHPHTLATLDKLWMHKEGPHFQINKASGLPAFQEK